MAPTWAATFRPLAIDGGGAQILDAAIGAGADEDAVDLHIGQRRARLQTHIGERAFDTGALVAHRAIVAGSGTLAGDRQRLFGRGAPGDHRRDVGGVERDLDVELRVLSDFSVLQYITAASNAAPLGARGLPGT